MKDNQGVTPSGPGSRPSAGADKSSPAKPSIPNAVLRPMTVNGYRLTPQQIAAGLGAMKGKFRVEAVHKALVAAGVVQSGPTRSLWSASTPYAAAIRIARRANEAGLIRPVHYQSWEAVKPRRIAAIAMETRRADTGNTESVAKP